MWAWLYLGLAGVAIILTWGFAVREQAIVFTSAVATVVWSLLALTSEITLVDGGGEVAISVGPARWIFAALGLLSMIALVGSILGVYPASQPDQNYSQI